MRFPFAAKFRGALLREFTERAVVSAYLLVRLARAAALAPPQRRRRGLAFVPLRQARQPRDRLDVAPLCGLLRLYVERTEINACVLAGTLQMMVRERSHELP